MRSLLVVALLVAALPVRAETVAVGVASNFVHTLRDIAAAFEAESGHTVRVSPSSSGKLFAQISNGAPLDVFLSADEERPRRLEAAGLAVSGSRFTYAVGRLTLWSTDPRYAGIDCAVAVRGGDFSRISIANPATAPYGAAAMQVLAAWGHPRESLTGRLALGENIAQTLQFVVTGNASVGLIARSQLAIDGLPRATCSVEIAPELHLPLDQQAVLLRRGERNSAAVAFVAFLRSERVRSLIAAHGYALPE